MDEFLLAEDALDGVALVPLPKFEDYCPDIVQDLFVADGVVLDEFQLARCFHRNHV
jgi:hypothetical protein